MAKSSLAPLLDRLQDGLAGRAFLYDSPGDYKAGVEDALHALTHPAEIRVLTGEEPSGAIELVVRDRFDTSRA